MPTACLQAPLSPVVNSTILYIGNLHWWTTDAALEAAVSEFGPVNSCRFLEERATGKSKGVAVVEFADAESAKKCKAEFNGYVTSLVEVLHKPASFHKTFSIPVHT
eukprot:GHUV01033829.1.p1 GENE.GHUV01033829.1~~GHUV01033829.1.p1  ORF type:complete len:106 (+),score=27.93 GHUV01033829.1:420-737(+)